MKNYKKYLALILGIVMVFAMTACGGGSSDEGGEAEEPAAAEEQEVLKVVTEATFAPFEFTEDGDDTIVGFDVDMMNAIAASPDNGLEFQVA